MSRVLIALVAALSILSATAGQALAFDCYVADKPVGAGSVGTVNIDTGEFTPSKPNPGDESQPHGGFVTLTGTLPDESTIEVDVFVNPPMTAKAPFAEPGVIPGATKQMEQGRGCDGKGLEVLEACFSGG